MSEGKPTPNNELCENCDDCLRFSGPHNSLDFRCGKCKNGYYFKPHDHSGKCHKPIENDCTKVNKVIGMEKVKGKEICVDKCPVGAYINKYEGRCQCAEFSHQRYAGDKRFCECPAHSKWNSAKNSCECDDKKKVLTHKGCAEDKSDEC